MNGFEKLEKMLTYTASFTSDGTSIAALTDNDIEDAVWSCHGSGNRIDYVVIDAPIDGFHATGFRAWYKSEPKSIKVWCLKNDKWHLVENLQIARSKYDSKLTEITFEKTCTNKVKIEFENDVESGEYTSAYELVITYTLEPWGGTKLVYHILRRSKLSYESELLSVCRSIYTLENCRIGGKYCGSRVL